MRYTFDVVVIGTGSAGTTVANRCRDAGWEVAVIDSRPFGGTCALRGCDPKKVLVGVAEAADWGRRMGGKGLSADRIRIDWPELMGFKRSFTDAVPAQRAESFADRGITAVRGRCRFVAPRAVQIDGSLFEAQHIVIAAGAMPVPLGIAGEEFIVTSDRFMDMESLPPRVVFIGGGYISFEFAHLAARAGARAAILHRGPRPLQRFDPDLVDLLVDKSRRLGIAVEFDSAVHAIERDKQGLVVCAASPGGERRHEADLVVHGAGRAAELDDMDLQAGGVAWTRRGVEVNEYLQSVSNPSVYAAGDAAASGGPPLTPVAGYEGRIVAANLIEGNHSTPDYLGIPSVVFTIPPLARVGLDEAEARQQQLRFRTNHRVTADWNSSRRVNEDCSAFKVLVEEGSDRILGAHLLGPHAEETVNLFALAIRSRVSAGDLSRTIFSYPTHASDVQYML